MGEEVGRPMGIDFYHPLHGTRESNGSGTTGIAVLWTLIFLDVFRGKLLSTKLHFFRTFLNKVGNFLNKELEL